MSAEDAACPTCGHPNPAENRFCGSCGARIAAPEPPAEPAAPAPASPQKASERAAERQEAAPELPPRIAAMDVMGRERELQSLLTRANVERMRALIKKSHQTLKEALVVADSIGPRASAQVHELLGDLLAMEERWEAARERYKIAHESDPERVVAEKKFAEMTVRLADEEALRRLGGEALRGDSLAEVLTDPRGKRNAGVAMIASLFAPGLGQVLCGQLVKGGICLGVFALCVAIVGLSPDRDALVNTMVGMANPAAAVKSKGGASEVSSLTWLAFIGIVVVWVYSVFEAPMSASRTRQISVRDSGIVDKSGWEP